MRLGEATTLSFEAKFGGKILGRAPLSIVPKVLHNLPPKATQEAGFS